MAEKKFTLPDPGEGLLEAEIVEWKVAVGDEVKINDIVVEVETAKSLVELPIPWAGTVTALLVEVGQEVPVGTEIIVIEEGGPDTGAPDEGASGAASPSAGSPSEGAAEEEPVKLLVGSGPKAEASARRRRRGAAVAPPVEAVVTPATLAQQEGLPVDNRHEFRPAAQVVTPDRVERSPRVQHDHDAGSKPSADGASPQARALAKPPVRKLAKDLGVDLQHVAGTGEGGIITRGDVEAAAAGSAAAQGSMSAASSSSAPPATSSAGAGLSSPTGARGETRVPVKGVRKMTAAAMVGSAFTAPHVTEWVTVDVTATMELVEKLKRDREFRDVKVTPLLVLAKAMCLAARRHPEINASWDEGAQEIVVKHYVNLGIAAATPRGLVVPNIKDADRMGMRELAEAIGALTATAREGRTPPADMAGGTMTITNVGVFGVDAGTPILNPGEAAILAFGAISRRPWVVEGPDGAERIEPRSVTTLALSFDHRLVDGELGSRFLADVAALLSDPSRALVWS